MNRIEFSDFYKFLVSLGIVLTSLALLLPWLFLRESFDALISASDIGDLTPTAQSLINYRQTTALWFIQNLVWISSLLAVIGLFVLGYGTFLWSKKQRVLDQKEQLETEKLRLEVKSMTPEQIAVKVIKETQEETLVEKEPSPIGPPEPITAPSSESYISHYFHIENALMAKLTACFGKDKVLTHQRVRDAEYDAVVNADIKSHDAIFELKLIRSPTNTARRIKEAANRLVTGVQIYMAATNRKAIGIGLFVFSEDYPDKLPTPELVRLAEELAKANNVSIRLHLLTEQELPRLQCSELHSMVFPTGIESE